MEQFRLKNLDTKGQPNLCQQFSENILISSALLQIGFCQRCKLKNSENNLLNMAVCETFNLPLTDYILSFSLPLASQKYQIKEAFKRLIQIILIFL